jgi:hypothetical protein
MILFAAGRGEALKRFVVDDGVGRDGKFWRLAQALSALYPNRIASRYGYAVRIQPVGPVDEALGAPTQMGIFERAGEQA